MTDKLREAAQQALEALEANQPINYCENAKGELSPIMTGDPFLFERNARAIASLRKALAGPVQEPGRPNC